VTNRANVLAGIGELGEISLRSPHLAAGYLGDEDLTRTKFGPSPLGEGRVYRTGDLGRYTVAGEVEFAGRADQQVKIRGFRVELGEIDKVLASHPGVRSVLLTTRDDAAGEKRIVAYVVPVDPSLDKGELRRAVREKLPEYMVPGAFVYLDSIPLTPNGKIDKAALPEPTEDHGAAPVETAASGSIEEILADIWKNVLELDRVDIRTNFFDLGGHSLLATRIAARIREALGVDMPVRLIFEAPTIAELAERVTAALVAAASATDLEDALASVMDEHPHSKS
jgi:acyl carrier protein